MLRTFPSSPLVSALDDDLLPQPANEPEATATTINAATIFLFIIDLLIFFCILYASFFVELNISFSYLKIYY